MRANPPESAAAVDDGSNGPIMFTRTRVISLFHAAVIITGYRQLTTTHKHIKIHCTPEDVLTDHHLLFNVPDVKRTSHTLFHFNYFQFSGNTSTKNTSKRAESLGQVWNDFGEAICPKLFL